MSHRRLMRAIVTSVLRGVDRLSMSWPAERQFGYQSVALRLTESEAREEAGHFGGLAPTDQIREGGRESRFRDTSVAEALHGICRALRSLIR
jgi:hypothetical protein